MSRTPKYAWADGMKAIEKFLIGGIDALEKHHRSNKKRLRQLKKAQIQQKKQKNY